METEILKFGIAGLVVVMALGVVKEAFSLAKLRMEKGNGNRTAGDMSPEYYDKRFDKIDTALAGIVSILNKQTDIMGSIRDMLIRQEGMGERFDGER